MLGNTIPINEPLLLDELANLLNHLIATLSRHQRDGLEDGKRGTSRLPLYTFLHLKSEIRKVIYTRGIIVNDKLVKLHRQRTY